MHTADYISGHADQKDRNRTIQSLKRFHLRLLFSTDLTSRGVDAINVDLVVNFDVPMDRETYLHRLGRAGRYGTHGVAVNMAAASQDANSGEEFRRLQNFIHM